MAMMNGNASPTNSEDSGFISEKGPLLHNVHPFLRLATMMENIKRFDYNNVGYDAIRCTMSDYGMGSIIMSTPPAGDVLDYQGFVQVHEASDLEIPIEKDALSYIRFLNNAIKIIHEHYSRIYIHVYLTNEITNDIDDLYLQIDIATCLLNNLKQFEPNCGIHERLVTFSRFYREVFIHQAMRLTEHRRITLDEARIIVQRAVHSVPEWLEAIFHIFVVVDMDLVLKTFIVVDAEYNSLLHYAIKHEMNLEPEIFECLIALCGSNYQNLSSQTPLDIAIGLKKGNTFKNMITELLVKNNAQLSIQLPTNGAEYTHRFRPIDDLTHDVARAPKITIEDCNKSQFAL